MKIQAIRESLQNATACNTPIVHVDLRYAVSVESPCGRHHADFPDMNPADCAATGHFRWIPTNISAEVCRSNVNTSTEEITFEIGYLWKCMIRLQSLK